MSRVALEEREIIEASEEYFFEEVGPEEFDYPGTGWFDDDGNEISLKEWRMVDDTLEEDHHDNGCHYRKAKFVRIK